MEPVISRYLLGLFEAGGVDSLAKTWTGNQVAESCDVDDNLVARKLHGLMDYLDEKLEILNSNLYRGIFSHVLKVLFLRIIT